MSDGWVGVDLDGTLAVYDHWRGENHIGEPIPAMVERVKAWLAAGVDVRIFTARVAATQLRGENGQDTKAFAARQKRYIQDWCEKHIGTRLPVTATKDFHMSELWDDRCVQVEPNTGRRMDGKE